AGYEPGDLDGRLIRVGSGGGEEEFLEILGQDLLEKAPEFCSHIRGVAGTDVGQLPRLTFDRFNHGLILVAEVNADELGGKVQISLAGSINEVASLGIGDMHRGPLALNFPTDVVQTLS